MSTKRPRTAYPFFPLKAKRADGGVAVFNPVERKEYVFDSDAWGLLSLCDGFHSLDEIVTSISEQTKTTPASVSESAEPILEHVTGAGMIWWRHSKLQRQPVPQPNAVFWDITLECNLRCAHCVLAAGVKQDQELDTTECKQLIDQMPGIGLSVVTLSGGEPLIRPDFFELAHHVRTRGFGLALSTNGTLVDRAAAREISRLEMDVQVSLDGTTAEEHERLRKCPGSFEATLAGIENLRSAGVEFTIGSVFNRNNAERFREMPDFAESVGARTFRMIPFIPAGRGLVFRELEPTPQELREMTHYLRERRKTCPITITPMEMEFLFEPGGGGPVDPSMQHGCDGARSSFSISATGEVLPCSFFTGIRAENVRDYPLRSIWASSPMLNYFRDLRATDIEGDCQNCAWFRDCLGGCPSANFSCGKMLSPNVRCWIAGSLNLKQPVDVDNSHRIHCGERRPA